MLSGKAFLTRKATLRTLLLLYKCGGTVKEVSLPDQNSHHSCGPVSRKEITPLPLRLPWLCQKTPSRLFLSKLNQGLKKSMSHVALLIISHQLLKYESDLLKKLFCT